MDAERHLITGEYPPQTGGVADYTATLARALAEAGEDVHVWCGGRDGDARDGAVTVHRRFGTFAPSDLRACAALMDANPRPRRVLIQWVPHAYGRRAVNLRFCRWLRARAAAGRDALEVMVHEPFLPWRGGLRQRAAAVIQRAMTATLLRAADRVWVATPAWEDFCRPYARHAAFTWAPIPSGVPVTAFAGDGEAATRALGLPRYAPIVGCFGRGGEYQRLALLAVARELEARRADARLLLVGMGSEGTREWMLAAQPALERMVFATGTISAQATSRALRACTLMVQPYVDGVCGRHSSTMAALAHGVPVITTSGRFTEPVWTTSGGVLLVPSADLQRLAETVVGVLADTRGLAQLSIAGARLYDNHFDVRHTVAALRHAS